MVLTTVFAVFGLTALWAILAFNRNKRLTARSVFQSPVSVAAACLGLFILLLIPVATLVVRGQTWLIPGYLLLLLPWHRKIVSLFKHLHQKISDQKSKNSFIDIEFLPGRFRVATSRVLVELHPATQDISGQIRKGLFAGEFARELSESQCHQLLSEYQKNSSVSCELLKLCTPDLIASCYRGNNQLPELDIVAASCLLGVRAGQGRQAIDQQFRQLIKGFHPDRRGSNWLATLIISAKGCLLSHLKQP